MNARRVLPACAALLLAVVLAGCSSKQADRPADPPDPATKDTAEKQEASKTGTSDKSKEPAPAGKTDRSDKEGPPSTSPTADAPKSTDDAIKAAIAVLVARKPDTKNEVELAKINAAISALESQIAAAASPKPAPPKTTNEPEGPPEIPVRELPIGELKLGHVGYMPSVDGGVTYVVVAVLSDTEVVFVPEYYESRGTRLPPIEKRGPHFILRRSPTKGLADGSLLKLEDKKLKVMGTKRLRGGQTLFVLEIAKPSEELGGS